MTEDHSGYPERQRAFLDMVKIQLSMVDDANTTLDNKLMALVGLSSLSSSLAALAISMAPTAVPPPVPGLVVLAYFCLIVMVASLLWEWRAIAYTIPGPPNTERDLFLAKYLMTDTVSAFDNLITAHQAAQIRIKAVVMRKGDALNNGLALYAIQLVILAGAIGIAFGAR